MRYSVIIPIFNAEKTLRRCVDSLLAQNFEDAEIILVNDGSQDNSGSICEEYARNNDNVICLSQKNGVVSAARNTGLDLARGEYVLFVDSDDHVTQDFFSVVDETVEKEHADWIQLSGCFDNGQKKQNIIHSYLSLHSREEVVPQIINAICKKTINGPCAKVYRSDILKEHNIKFPEGVSVAEDRAFNIVYSFHVQSYAACENIVYIINTQNENSLSRKRHKDLLKQFDIADSYLDSKLEEATIPEDEKNRYREAIDFGKCRSIYHDAKLMIQDHLNWSTRQKSLLKLCKNINGKHMRYPKTRYCTMISLPVRLCITPMIDVIAKKLIRNAGE